MLYSSLPQMKKSPDSPSLEFESVSADDLEALFTIRTAAMRPSLEQVGRFDPARSRQRLLDSFYPAHPHFIVHQNRRVGFHPFRSDDNFLKLNHR